MRSILIITLLATLSLSSFAQKNKQEPTQKQTVKKEQYKKQKKEAAQQQKTEKLSAKGQTKPQSKKRNGKGKAAQKGSAVITTEEIKGLREQNKRLQQEINENAEAIKVKQKDVDNRLQQILTLEGEIGQHLKTIDTIASDIHTLDDNIVVLKGQLVSLEAQLKERRARFIRSMQYMARNRSVQDKIMFVFSAKSLTQMYRRLRFVRNYASYQRAQGELLKAKQRQVDNKHKQLAQVRVKKRNLLAKDRRLHADMERKKTQQQSVVASLQNDQKVLQSVIADRQKKQQAINAQIDRLVAIEVEKARQRAIAEQKAREAARAAEAKKRAAEQARKKAEAERIERENARRIAEAKEREEKARKIAAERKAAAERARKAAADRLEAARRVTEKARLEKEAKASAARERELKKAQEREEAARKEEEKARAQAEAEKARADQEARAAESNRIAAERKAAVDKERAERDQAAARRAEEPGGLMTNADRAMSGSFANSKGRLPMPASGKIIGGFGTYNVAGMKNVQLSNSGINIKAGAGAPVRSVYKGEVSAIWAANGSTIVMVRHGIYISVYANLGSVSVRKGQTVGIGQTLGTVDRGGVLQFQLRKETQQLNPMQWLR